MKYFWVLLFISGILYAGPRFPNPQTPDQIWQNDKDLLDQINQSPNRFKQRTSIPLLSPCSPGDIMWNIAPAAGGKVGWICINSSGTWKAFGAIDP